MADIFLSYASEDATRVTRLVRVFEKQQWSVWWDYKIPPGKSFDQVIEEEITKAKCVVVLWSQQSISSDWIRTEADEGLRRRILAPVLIDNVTIPLGFRRIEAAKLYDWRGDSSHPELKLLLQSIDDILKRTSDSIEPTNKEENRRNDIPSEHRNWKILSLAAAGAGVLLILFIWITSNDNSYRTASPSINQTTPLPTSTPAISPTPSPSVSTNLGVTPRPTGTPSVAPTATATPIVTPQPDLNAVRRFYFIYLANDPQKSERHDWAKVDENRWFERFPNGTGNYIQIINRITVDGDSGTLLSLSSFNPPLEYFIPDKGSRFMWLRIRPKGGQWGVLGEMKDVE